MPSFRNCSSASRLVCMVSALAAVVLVATAARAQDASRHEISLEVFGGTAWSFHTPLTVRLPGMDALRQTAHYSTRPFAGAPYYAYRIGYGTGSHGIDAELLHHKLYLENPAPPIEHFEVTHGYNLVTTNGRAPVGRWQLRAGVGLVIAHAEGTIAGQPVGRRRTFLGGGYHIAGATTQVSFGRRYPLSRGEVAAFATPEIKLTASTARVPVGDGSVRVPNVALHALSGLGVRRR